MTEDRSLVPFGFDTSILTGSVAESSMKMYKRDFQTYLDYAVTPEVAVKSSTFARWRTHLANSTTLSPNTINRMMSAVKRMMRTAEQQGYVAKGTYEDFKHVEGVKVGALRSRKKSHARTYSSPEQMRTLTSLPDLLTLSGLRDSALLHTLASSGTRVHEAAKLRKVDIIPADSGYQIQIMGKNDLEYRNAPLRPEAYQAIQKWLKARSVDSVFIFTSFEGRGEDRLTSNPMHTSSIWRTVKSYADQCGLEHIKPHDFRRFVGTQLAKKSPHSAQKALGHKDITTTFNNYVLSDLEIGITDDLY